MVTTEQVKQLRDETGVSIMQCKKALEEADGDKEKALAILKKQSSEIADKKSDRSLGAGAVSAYVHATGTVGSLVVLSCETDFVAKNEEFQQLAYDIAMHVTAMNPEFLSEDDITEKDKESAREVFAKEVEGSEKSDEIKEKMLQGKIDSFFSDKVLLKQSFVKNPDVTIEGLIKEAVQKFGENIQVSQFTRLSV